MKLKSRRQVIPLKKRAGKLNPRKLSIIRSRLILVWLILVMASVILIIKLLTLQIGQGPELQARAKEQQAVKARPFVPRRPIVDRNGNVLAIDRPVYTLYAHPILFQKSKEEVAAKLAPVLAGIVTPPPDINKLLTKLNSAASGIYIATSLPEEIANDINKLRLDGLELIPSQQRLYPQQDVAAEVVGYVDSDRQGQAGIEYSQQNLLERTMPELRFRRTIGGVLVPEQLASGFVALDDLQLQLTIDTRLQRAARSSLKQEIEKFKAKRGAVIVMDARDGSLLALVTEPSYDPNQYYNFDVSLFKNWALTDVYEPGSTLKPFNVAIALEAGGIQPDSTIYDAGRIKIDKWTIENHDYKSRGPRGNISITKVLQYSSNIGMVRIMQQIKPSKFYESLQKLGLGQPVGMDLPGEVSSQLKSRNEFIYSPIEPATAAFGQGLSITPMHLVKIAGTLANGGKLVTPHVVRGLFNSKGEANWEPHIPVPKQVFSPETAKIVLGMLEKVVEDGTGKLAEVPGYRLAGKTGTSQKAVQGGYAKFAVITSFFGIVPLEAPHYVVLAVVDEPRGGYGGTVAAPIVKSVVEALVAIENIPPSQNQPPNSPKN